MNARQKLRAMLERAGMAERVVTFEESARSAADAAAAIGCAAAAAIGCAVGAIGSSLVFMVEDEPVLIITSGAHRVDVALVARHLGGAALTRATPEQVRAATGFAIGGVAPVGHPGLLRVLIDEDLAQHPKIWVAAGHPNSVLWLTYDELLALTRGAPTRVA